MGRRSRRTARRLDATNGTIRKGERDELHQAFCMGVPCLFAEGFLHIERLRNEMSPTTKRKLNHAITTITTIISLYTSKQSLYKLF